MPVNKIFFSYSRTDGTAFALRLASDLKQAGFNVWIDQKDIRAGTEWDLEIAKALETCDCLLFIETAHSVISNNVLDEVYYALEQNKKVIPVILHDSKTPFRLQRLQHIDFTRDYDSGLSHLISELRGNATTEFFSGVSMQTQRKAVQNRWLAIGVSLTVVAGAALLFWFTRNAKVVEKKEEAPVNLIDANTSVKQTISSDTVKRTEGLQEISTATTGKTTVRRSTKVPPIEIYSGDYRLANTKPSATSFRGYLKIDAAGQNKATIKTHFQFYFPKTNDTAYLAVFNGFAGCSSCLLQKDMKLVVEDVAIGTQRYTILKKDIPGVGKAGDTTSSAGGNTSIRAAVTMHLEDDNTVLIKVKRQHPAELSFGIIMKPFEYSFRFKKTD